MCEACRNLDLNLAAIAEDYLWRRPLPSLEEARARFGRCPACMAAAAGAAEERAA